MCRMWFSGLDMGADVGTLRRRITPSFAPRQVDTCVHEEAARAPACKEAKRLATVVRMTTPSCAALPCLLLLSALALAGTPSTDAPPNTLDSASEHSVTTLILAGGALPICSDLALRACTKAPDSGASSRAEPRYQIRPESFHSTALDDSWPAQRRPLLRQIERMLGLASSRLGDTPVGAREIEDVLFTLCLDARNGASCPRRKRSPWQQMTDAERTRVLSALELPQQDPEGRRKREGVHLDLNAQPHGEAVLRAFVEAASLRSPDRVPRVLVVTASSLDPMEPVDFYLSALEALGAQATWWPLDAALARTLENGDCSGLGTLRAAVLGLHAREHVYPDLHAQQEQVCAQPQALMAQLDAAQGVFFSGGDQWRLRQAFFAADGSALPWLTALRAAHARGDLVVAGTSAGAAVQAGAAMLTNGSPASALIEPARRAAPPEPGCARAGLCSADEEVALTIWPAGGLGLAAQALVDTHFSERAREPRLLRLLAQTDARFGFGVDEASALRIDSADGVDTVEAVGKEGGWVFVRDPTAAPGALQALVFHLAPGTRLRLGATGAALLDPLAGCIESGGSHDPWQDAAPPDPSEVGEPDARANAQPVDISVGGKAAEDALQPGATRSAARDLARCGLQSHTLAAGAGALSIERLGMTAVATSASGHAIGPLRMRWQPD